MLQVVDLGVGARARGRLQREEERLVPRDLSHHPVRAGLAVVAGGHRLPLLGERHHGPRVEDAEAEEVVELEADAVHGPVEAALGVEQGVALGGEHGQVLHVAPRQLRAAKEEINWGGRERILASQAGVLGEVCASNTIPGEAVHEALVGRGRSQRNWVQGSDHPSQFLLCKAPALQNYTT